MTRKLRNPCAGNTGANIIGEKNGGFSQRMETIKVYPKGVKTVGRSGRVGLPPGAGGRRGKIKGWSSSSRRRFRDWLLKHEADSEIFAVTLTVPGDVVTPDQWRSLFDAFSKFLSKKGVGAVWRLETQKRGQPHLHMIVTAPESLAVSGDIEDRLNCVYAWFQSCWFKYIDRFLPPCEGRIKTGSGSSDSGYGIPRSALMGADRHAVDVEADTGKTLWWRYLCDHTSKSKQEQVFGWDGFRHWGVVCEKRRFREIEPESWRVPRDAFVKVYRWLRASSRRRIRDNRCVFGSRLAVSPRRHSGGSAVWFGITADVIERLMDYALALSSS